MVDIKGLGGIRAADKTKAKARTGATGGTSFADMLEEAQSTGEVESALPVESFGASAGYVPMDDEDDLPRNPRHQAQELLKTLQTLAEDALSGSPTAVVDRLEKLTASIDESSLTTQQKEALDEARTRAAVEAAKLKA